MESLERIFRAFFVLHPLHSMIVHFPIALTAVGFLFIVLARWRRDEMLEQVAFYNIALAAVSTLVAGLTGLRDNIVRFGGAAPNVNAKVFLGISLLILTSATALIRLRRPDILWRPTTTVLYLAAFAFSFLLAVALGFLGGVILYGF
jgi:uncharacterized membrane protein